MAKIHEKGGTTIKIYPCKVKLTSHAGTTSVSGDVYEYNWCDCLWFLVVVRERLEQNKDRTHVAGWIGKKNQKILSSNNDTTLISTPP